MGSTLSVNVGDRAVPLTVRGLLRDEGPARVLDGHFVLMDIASAQLALDRFGRVDRLEVRLADTAMIAEAELGHRRGAFRRGSRCSGRRSGANRSSTCWRRSIST